MSADIRPIDRERLAARLADFIAIAQDVPGEYWEAEHFLKELPEKWRLSLAAWEGERPIGYAVISRKNSAVAHLHHFMVAPHQRGQGLGARLLDAAVQACAGQGYRAISLKVGLDNAKAHSFYRRHAFADSGTSGDYRIMQRALGPTVVVAIHQPNYVPWLGYFWKIAQSDVFVFLDDVQYSKNSYINRAQIDEGGAARWLTVPVTYRFGEPINTVQAAAATWRRSHLDRLKNCYAGAPGFAEVFSWLEGLLEKLPEGDLAAVNQALIEALAGKLGIRTPFMKSSSLDTGALAGDDRLLAVLKSVGPDVTYLSGKGGASYQDPAKFEDAGIVLRYSDFVHPAYAQGHDGFLPGLSVLDALFRLGFERAAALLVPARNAA